MKSRSTGAGELLWDYRTSPRRWPAASTAARSPGSWPRTARARSPTATTCWTACAPSSAPSIAAEGSRGQGLEEMLLDAVLAEAQRHPSNDRVECQTLFSTAAQRRRPLRPGRLPELRPALPGAAPPRAAGPRARSAGWRLRLRSAARGHRPGRAGGAPQPRGQPGRRAQPHLRHARPVPQLRGDARAARGLRPLRCATPRSSPRGARGRRACCWPATSRAPTGTSARCRCCPRRKGGGWARR